MEKRKVRRLTVVEQQEQEVQHPLARAWAHGADVMATWKRHGFVPPTEVRNDYMFKINRESSEK